MHSPRRQLEWLVWGGVALTILVIVAAFVRGRARRDTAPPLPVLAALPDFTLTNDAGARVTLAGLRGQVWVADIIFTRCPGPCAQMTRQMAELQAALPADGARFVSLTTDPDFDTPAVLAAYARRAGARPDRWQFLTGDKPQLAALAAGGLKLTAMEKEASQRENPNDLFIHSTIFALVDRAGRLRAAYETAGEGVDWEQSKRNILTDVKQLLRERRP
jgi:protein SCO1/2